MSRNLRKTWSFLNSVINKNQIKDVITELTINNVNITDPNTIVNSLNDYFVSIGSKLASTIENGSPDLKQYLSKDYRDSLVLLPTEPQEIINIVSGIANKSSFGWDNIPVNIVKMSITSIAYPLSCLINHST